MRHNESGFEKIDAKGKHIYPGLIAPNSFLGLIEFKLVRAANDMHEVGQFNPNVRSIIAGSLVQGKDAKILITTGEILDMRGNKIEKAFIRGRAVETENWQHDLYEKFSNKCNPD